MKNLYVVLIPAVVTMVGCASPVPVAENFSLSYQKVARTAHHWDVVADDIVSQTLQTITEKPLLQGRGVYVPSVRSTAFNSAFREFLITRFVNRGTNVSVCKIVGDGNPGFVQEAPDVEIQYETQVIGHGGQMPHYRPGEITALASGVAVLRNVAEANLSRGAGNAALIGIAALADVGAGHLGSPTRTELIVTTTIAERNRFIMRRSDIYYVPDADAKLFIQNIKKQSACPQEKMATASIPDEREAAMARQEMIERNMRRVNPDWRGPSPESVAAYSY